MNSQNDNSLSYLDVLTVFSVILQMVGFQQDQKQTSNDVLFKELQRQDRDYLDKILVSQKKILALLSDIKSDIRQ